MLDEKSKDKYAEKNFIRDKNNESVPQTTNLRNLFGEYGLDKPDITFIENLIIGKLASQEETETDAEKAKHYLYQLIQIIRT